MESSLQSWVQHSALRVTLIGGVPSSIQRTLSIPNSILPRLPTPSTNEFEQTILQRLEREEKKREDSKHVMELKNSAKNRLDDTNRGDGSGNVTRDLQGVTRQGNDRTSHFVGIDTNNTRSTHPAIHEDPRPPTLPLTTTSSSSSSTYSSIPLSNSSNSSSSSSSNAHSTSIGRYPPCIFTSACTFTASDKHWHCHACTYANKHETISCEICNYMKKPEPQDETHRSEDVWSGATIIQSSTTNNNNNIGGGGGNGNIGGGGVNATIQRSIKSVTTWICHTCTLENTNQSKVCEACGTTQTIDHTLV